MDRTLLALPAELQVSIFNSLADLDDARSLSNTCRSFRSLYITHQKTIKRAIITRSPVYLYDHCLSNLLHAWQDAAKVLREYDGIPPINLRLSGSVCLDCFDDADTLMTDVDVDEISKRWWKLSILRDLYLDEAISRSFEKYKVQFVSRGPEYLGPDGIGPTIEESLELATQTTHNLEVAPDFKARFHQSLCLHSIALATRSHAMHSRDIAQYNNAPPNFIGTILFSRAGDLWKKHCMVLNGHAVQLSRHVQFDCLEMFDFLYYFLLETLVPLDAVESWFNDNLYRFPYDEMGDGSTIDCWIASLRYFRLTLQPSDIADLVKHKTWRAESDFPIDKTNYMCERGLFDLYGYGAVDFYTAFGRRSMIDVLEKNKSRSWDELRIKSGSPFWPRFWQMLDLEAKGVDPAEAGTEDHHDCLTSSFNTR